MKQPIITIRNTIVSLGYRYLLKPVFFHMDPEKVHDRTLALGKRLGSSGVGRTITKTMFSYSHPSLKQTIAGIEFPNPIGLAAGFDKDAELTDILPSVGFGFEEVGSITGEPCKGNKGTRLWRLPKSKSLVVYYGLKNTGCEAISKRLKDKQFTIPIGISIAKTNSPDTCDLEPGIADYEKAFKHFTDIGDYMTVNISCPNTYGGEPFTDPERLDALLTRLDAIEYTKPVFVKLSPDLDKTQLDALIDCILKHRVHGVIISNLTKNRTSEHFRQKVKEDSIPDKGGLSGKVVEDLSNDAIKHVYTKTKGKLIIIGCGGVFTAQDAYTKIKAGASLIQLITGMVYQGPQTISTINQGLVKLLKRDGYASIGEAVGSVIGKTY